jgi:hypothetical protein
LQELEENSFLVQILIRCLEERRKGRCRQNEEEQKERGSTEKTKKNKKKGFCCLRFWVDCGKIFGLENLNVLQSCEKV